MQYEIHGIILNEDEISKISNFYENSKIADYIETSARKAWFESIGIRSRERAMKVAARVRELQQRNQNRYTMDQLIEFAAEDLRFRPVFVAQNLDSDGWILSWEEFYSLEKAVDFCKKHKYTKVFDKRNNDVLCEHKEEMVGYEHSR